MAMPMRRVHHGGLEDPHGEPAERAVSGIEIPVGVEIPLVKRGLGTADDALPWTRMTGS